MSRAQWLPFVTSIVLVGACGSSPARNATTTPSAPAAEPVPAPPSAPPVQDIDIEPVKIEIVHGDDATEFEVYDARDLFDRADAAFEGDEFAIAIEHYERLVREFPDSALVPPALFNWGLSLEATGEVDRAIERFRQASERGKGTRHELDALIRIGAAQAGLGRFGDAEAAFAALLTREDLTVADRVEVMARRGYTLVESKQFAEAEKQLTAAIELFRTSEGTEHLETDFYLAMSHYYLGDIARRQFAAQPLRLPDAQLQKDLEAKANLALLAQDRFENTVKLVNVYWATAAIYQMGQIQSDLWKALTEAPVPDQLDAQAREVYVAEVAKVARPHLERSFEIHGKNLEVERLYQTETEWSKKSRDAMAEVTELLARDGGAAPTLDPDARLGSTDPADYIPARYDL